MAICTCLKVNKTSISDSLPVLFTGAGPLGAVHHLSHACYQARRGISQACVELCGLQNPAAVRRVPRVVAVRPRQQVCHGHEEVIESDADDHVVIDSNVGGHHHHAVAHT